MKRCLILCMAVLFQREAGVAGDTSLQMLERDLSVVGCGVSGPDEPDLLTPFKGKAKEIFPQLKEILLSTSNECVAFNIFAILGEGNLEPELTSPVLRQFLARNNIPDRGRVLVALGAIQALGKIGNSDDAVFLLEGIEQRDNRLRVSTFEAVGAVGDRRAQRLITEWLRTETNRAKLPKEVTAAGEATKAISKRNKS